MRRTGGDVNWRYVDRLSLANGSYEGSRTENETVSFGDSKVSLSQTNHNSCKGNTKGGGRCEVGGEIIGSGYS